MRHLLKRIFIRNRYVFSFFRSTEMYLRLVSGIVHDPEYHVILKFIGHSSKEISILDIGANIGQSLVSFNNLFSQFSIDCIEPSRECIPTLTRLAKIINIRRRSNTVSVHHGALLPCERVKDIFYVPVTIDGAELLQEGSFDRSIFDLNDTKKRIGQKFALKETYPPMVNKLALREKYDIIKVDVQGEEYAVLQLLESINLLTAKCIIVENDFRNFSKVYRLLRRYNYRSNQQWENTVFYR